MGCVCTCTNELGLCWTETSCCYFAWSIDLLLFKIQFTLGDHGFHSGAVSKSKSRSPEAEPTLAYEELSDLFDSNPGVFSSLNIEITAILKLGRKAK